MSFIGIDLGASFIKGAILDVEGNDLGHVLRVPFPPFRTTSTFEREVDTDLIIAAVHGILDRLLQRDPRCEGLLLCGQMHGLVLCTAHGEAVSPFISWQDQRILSPPGPGGVPWYQLLRGLLRGFDVRLLGNELRPGLPLSTLYYLAATDHLPRHAYPASLTDYVVARLCRSAPVMSESNAAAHGAFNVADRRWEHDAIRALGLSCLTWPEIRPPGVCAGTFSHRDRTIPCYTPIGDQQSALLGSGLQEQELSLNIATGSQVSLLVGHPELGEYQTRPYFDGLYLKTITHLPAGRSLNALIRLLIEFSPEKSADDPELWEYLETEAGKVDRTDLSIDLTFFCGALGSEGRIQHITERTLNVGHLFRAAFQGMAANYLACALRLSPQRQWHQMVMSGGLIAKSAVLRNCIHDVFGGIPERRPSSEEDALMGLLIVACAIADHDESVRSVGARVVSHRTRD